MDRWLPGALVCLLLTPSIGLADVQTPPASPKYQVGELIGPVPDQESRDREVGLKDRTSGLNWETGAGRSYIIPAGELLAYLFLLNQYDRHFTEPKAVYRTDGGTIRQHLTDSKWVLDNDQFSVNQFLHPYGGNIYYGIARSTGLSFWESFLYSSAGRSFWEIAGETTSA